MTENAELQAIIFFNFTKKSPTKLQSLCFNNCDGAARYKYTVEVPTENSFKKSRYSTPTSHFNLYDLDRPP